MRTAVRKLAAQAAGISAREQASQPAAAVVSRVGGTSQRVLSIARSEPGVREHEGDLTQVQSSLAALALSRARASLRESKSSLEGTCLTCTAEPSPEIIEMAMEMGVEISMSEPFQEHDTEILVQALVLDPTQEHVLLHRHREGPFAGRLTGLIKSVPSLDAATPETVHKIVQGFDPNIKLDETTPPQLYGVMDFFELHGDPILEFEFLAVAKVKKEPAPGLEWWPRDKIPFASMPADDEVWYPAVLDRQDCRGYFVFDGQILDCSYMR